MKQLFWFSVIALIYTYIGYPLIMFVIARVRNNAVRKDREYKSMVSVIVAAYNEEKHIMQRVTNLLDSAYPKDKLEILIGSDGSMDGTNDILSQIRDTRVKIFIFPERRGKVSVLNELVPKATGDILVFCDIRQIFDTKAISELVSNFADTRVGCVSGELVFTNEAEESGVSEGIGLYWDYEKFIRGCESAAHSMVGATGAIYAIRRKLYSPPPADTILDDVYIPLAIARQGYRSVWDSAAKAYDKPALTSKAEYRRKVRTLAGNWQIFGMFRDLLISYRSAVSVPLLSHKLLRVLAPFFMIFLFFSNLIIAKVGYYGAFFIVQVAFYILAIVGSVTYMNGSKRIVVRLASAVYTFCLLNFTALAGLYRFLSGTQNIAWEK